jgi:hypothetical protein
VGGRGRMFVDYKLGSMLNGAVVAYMTYISIYVRDENEEYHNEP